jgi:hypothetical protein
MEPREATNLDFEAIRAIHKRMGYPFELPRLSGVRGMRVIEEDGEIVAMAGWERAAHVVCVLDAHWGSPHRRLEALRLLHQPLARSVLKDGVEYAFSFLDPRWPQFGKRLMNLGWEHKLWAAYQIRRETIERKLALCA